MGFLTDPQNAQYVNPGQVGQVARGFVPPQNRSYDVGGQMMQAPMPIESAPQPHIADRAANIVGQYITDHGNLLRQRLQMAHAAGTLAPPRFATDVRSLDPGFTRPGINPAFLKNIPSFTRDPGFSNQGALEARLQHGAAAALPRLIQAFQAQRYNGRH